MISDLLPHLGAQADELCFIHSMQGKTNTHGPGENFMSTCNALDGFPSMGAWVTYALGSECRDLPAFVAIPDPRGVPQNGPRHWQSAFLPAVFQGTAFNAGKPIPNPLPWLVSGTNTFAFTAQNGPDSFAGVSGATYAQNPAAVVFGGSSVSR